MNDDRLGVQRLLVAVEPLARTRTRPPLAKNVSSLRRLVALVLERDRDALVQERQLAQPVGEGVVVELEVGEDLGVGLEADRRAGARCALPSTLSFCTVVCRARSACGAACRRGPPRPRAARRARSPPRRRRRAGRPTPCSCSCRTCRRRAARSAPPRRPGIFSVGCMSTGMPRPLSVDRDRVVGVDRDVDAVAVAGQRLVDRVVHHLVDEVVQAALAGGPDVHAGPLADRLEALEDRDRFRVVVLLPAPGRRCAAMSSFIWLVGPTPRQGPSGCRGSVPGRPAFSRARIVGVIRLSSLAHAGVATRTRSTPSGVTDSASVTAAIASPTRAGHSSMIDAWPIRSASPDAARKLAIASARLAGRPPRGRSPALTPPPARRPAPDLPPPPSGGG